MNFSVCIDDKQRAFAHTIFVAINTVAARHVPLWLKVGQKGEMKLAIARECGVAPRAIHRNADQFRTELVEFLQHFVVESHLIAADRTPIGRIKGEHDRLATELAESEPLIRRASQREVGASAPGGSAVRRLLEYISLYGCPCPDFGLVAVFGSVVAVEIAIASLPYRIEIGSTCAPN